MEKEEKEEEVSDPTSASPLEYLTECEVLDIVHFKSVAFRRSDSKDFVDRPLVANTSASEARRRVLQVAGRGNESDTFSATAVDEILGSVFGEPGSDLEVCAPDDWSRNGPHVLKIGEDEKKENAKASELARYIHSCWPELCKRCARDVRSNPSRHTLLLMPNKLFVPGSRFREQYYWDSYFTLQGFLVSGMVESAMQIISNLLYCVNKYGYVPNGTRSYYLGRTQPPLLSEMLVDLWKWASDNANNVNVNMTADGAEEKESLKKKAKDLVITSLPLLVREHKFLTGRHRTVKVLGKQGGVFDLVRYYAGTSCPRPESHKEDTLTARMKVEEILRERGDGHRVGETKENENENENAEADEDEDKDKEGLLAGAIYKEIATMAESGWDFSSRWLRNPLRLDTAQITRILPVDLNTIVARMEANISLIAKLSQEETLSKTFGAMSRRRFEAIDEVLWDEESCQWKDLWLKDDHVEEEEEEDASRAQRQAAAESEKEKFFSGTLNPGIYASNWLPLWRGGGPSCKQRSELAIKSLESSGLVLPGGIATSLKNCGHQWDYPNAWAPLQYLIYQALISTGLNSGSDLACTIAEHFLRNVYATYTNTGRIHEKYSAVEPGQYGKGGEYEPQTGFGWTNGVVLRLLVKHSECIL